MRALAMAAAALALTTTASANIDRFNAEGFLSATADPPMFFEIPQAPAQPAGQPTGQVPEPLRIDEDLFYPAQKPEVIGREQWIRAEAKCEHLEENEVNDVDVEVDVEPRVRVAVHHSATIIDKSELVLNEAQSKERVKQLLCGIRRYHMGIVKKQTVGKGKRQHEVTVKVGGHDWSDIGYHFVIDWRGNIWEGRKLEKVGAHVKLNNPGSIGVMLLGHFQVQKPTTEQLRSLKRLLAYIVHTQKIDPNGIRGHGDLASGGHDTQCPGSNLSRRGEEKQKFVAAKASPLRRIREELKPLWQRVPHAKNDDIDFAEAETALGPLAFARD